VKRLRRGEFVAMRGYLVNVTGPNGFSWNTSLRRDDTGNGACELFYVEAIETNRSRHCSRRSQNSAQLKDDPVAAAFAAADDLALSRKSRDRGRRGRVDRESRTLIRALRVSEIGY
jgi:hypothetical protein